ncbi:MAG: queuine tRNA-ribosyltransferase, partial [Candidatus Omnitrophota bacterium]
MYKLLKKDNKTKARRGELTTDHGAIQTPFFMPVGTNGTVKSLDFEDMRNLGAQIMLSNTYHLNLRPGMDIIRNQGGLHKMMGWERPLLTDSGGYQIFSLAKLRKLTDEGVVFQSHLDGSAIELTPEKVVAIEQDFGVDMMMPLDECAPYPCAYEPAKDAVRRTTLWARRAKDYFEANKRTDINQKLFAIIQGSIYKDLRERSAQEVVDLDFDAYAIGGVSVGETVVEMFESLRWTEPIMPVNKPR